MGLPDQDPGIEELVRASLEWLCRAQDSSATPDGGVARHFSLLHGWGASYPETTGYIVPTFIHSAHRFGWPDLRDRARRMVDWLVSIQLEGGGFQGGTVSDRPIVPVTFNTGQILLGLSSAVLEFGETYREPLERAAGWLVATQDSDGCWRRYPTPFAQPGEKVYETHAAWGLLEAYRAVEDKSYVEAALANIRWAIRQQRDDGWFDHCCLDDPEQPPTHTIGYALMGVLGAHQFTGETDFLASARRTADGLLGLLREDGFLPGRVAPGWRGTVRWACLPGTVQLAHCWLVLHRLTGEERYRKAGALANRFVRRSMRLKGPDETRGGVKGSFPIYGGYGNCEYVSWGAKFFVDAHLCELEVRGGPDASLCHQGVPTDPSPAPLPKILQHS